MLSKELKQFFTDDKIKEIDDKIKQLKTSKTANFFKENFVYLNDNDSILAFFLLFINLF